MPRAFRFLFSHSAAVSCLCCGGCGHLLDVWWASGQAVAHRDGALQTSLRCQLTPFPRVPQSKRPSESNSANTQGGEAEKNVWIHSEKLNTSFHKLRKNSSHRRRLQSRSPPSQQRSLGAAFNYFTSPVFVCVIHMCPNQ